MKLYRIVYSCIELYRIVQIISISRSLLFGQSLLRQPQLHRKPTQAARWTWTRSVPFGSEQFAVKYKIIVQLTTMIFPFGFALRPNTVDVIQTNTVCKGVVMPKKNKGSMQSKTDDAKDSGNFPAKAKHDSSIFQLCMYPQCIGSQVHHTRSNFGFHHFHPQKKTVWICLCHGRVAAKAWCGTRRCCNKCIGSHVQKCQAA